MTKPTKLLLEGKDNYDRPRQDYADKLAGKSDEEFVREASSVIWLSAWANNNRRSDYHWMAGACYDEAHRRDNPELYNRAWRQASGKE